MRTFDRPLTLLVAKPQLVPEGIVLLLREYGLGLGGWQRGPGSEDGEALVELMGRLCYGSFGPRQGRIGAAAYIGNIVESGHGSVLEHAYWSFVVCRAGRGFTHQMTRHRAGFAFSQESTHFVRYSADAPAEGEGHAPEAGFSTCGIPERYRNPAVEAATDAVKAYAGLWQAIREDFPDGTAGKKQACSAARNLLPTGLESRLGFTGNGRALRHFCEYRGGRENSHEIRHVAADVARMMKAEAPAIFADVHVEDDAGDGHPATASVHRKV